MDILKAIKMFQNLRGFWMITRVNVRWELIYEFIMAIPEDFI